MTDPEGILISNLAEITDPKPTDYFVINRHGTPKITRRVRIDLVSELLKQSPIPANTEVLSADRSLTDADAVIQYLDPGGAARDVPLPTAASTNHPFVISNRADADETLTVYDGVAVVDTVGQGETKMFFSDGSAWAGLSGGGGGGGGGREILTANRTYYVRTDGNDSNDGLTNSAGGAFLTIQKAIDTAAALDTGIYNVTIQLADGTYNSGAVTLKDILGSGTVTIVGNDTTPANVVVTGTYRKDTPGTIYAISGQKLVASSGGDAIMATGGGVIRIQLIDFGSGYSSHIVAATSAVIVAIGNYTISAGASGNHIAAVNCGVVHTHNRTVTLTGTPGFTNFIYASALSLVTAYGMTFIGSATGKRYEVTANAIINVGGGGANYLPGNAAGSAANGGLYV